MHISFTLPEVGGYVVRAAGGGPQCSYWKVCQYQSLLLLWMTIILVALCSICSASSEFSSLFLEYLKCFEECLELKIVTERNLY